MQVRTGWVAVLSVAAVVASSTPAVAAPSIGAVRSTMKAAVAKTAAVRSAVNWTVTLSDANGSTVTTVTRTDSRGGVERAGQTGERFAPFVVGDVVYLPTGSVPAAVAALVDGIDSVQWLTRPARDGDRFASEVVDTFARTGAASVIASASSATRSVASGVTTLRFKRARTTEQVTVTIRGGLVTKMTVVRAGAVTASVTMEAVPDARILRPVGMSAPYPQQASGSSTGTADSDGEQQPDALDDLQLPPSVLQSTATAVINATRAAATRRQGPPTLDDLFAALEALTDDTVGTELLRVSADQAVVDFHNVNDRHVAVCVVVGLQGSGEMRLDEGRCPR